MKRKKKHKKTTKKIYHEKVIFMTLIVHLKKRGQKV